MSDHPQFNRERADRLYGEIWDRILAANVVALRKVREDLMTWRRGSAQMVLRINPQLNNISIYSVLLSDVTPTEALYRHLLHYNVLQRRESLGMMARNGKWYVVLKYTMELEVMDTDALISHVYYLQEKADELDTGLADQFGGQLHYEDWDKLDQHAVDNLLDKLFD